MFVMIAAIGKNNELGKKGDLVWDLPNDLKFFKEQTLGKKVFMGKRTFESLPKKLPNREHFVLTDAPIDDDEINLVWDLDKFVEENKYTEEEIFVIGGGMVYKQMLPHSKKMYLTEVNDECLDADTYFPQFDKNDWTSQIIGENSDGDISYIHILYTLKD